MVLKLVQDLILLPFKLFDGLVSAFLYPKKLGERELQELEFRRKMDKKDYLNHQLADQNVFLQHQLSEVNRLHQVDKDQMEAKYRKIIRELERELNRERVRKGSQP